MNRRVIVATCGLLALVMGAAGAAAPGTRGVPLSATARMPVKEVTVFKDGHAFVLHEGKLPTDAAGNVVMDYLPTPVMGTFWPYSGEANAKLTSVLASKRKVLVKRTALNIRELLEANVGAEIVVTEKLRDKEQTFAAKIVGVPTRSSQELEATSPPNSGDMLPQKGQIILLKTADGVRAMPINRIQDVTFKDPPQSKRGNEEFRNLLTLKLDWGNRRPKKMVDAGLVYVQRGIRWIPSYRITIDGKGKAVLKLQATLLNEMVDLKDVTTHLVIGVPTFAFKDTADPISLRRTVAQLSQYFREDARTRFALSNTLMTQTALMEPRGAPAGPRGPDLGPELRGSVKSEDLFVFTVEHITLRKGERMVLPVVEFPLDYKDVYILDLPFAPPPMVSRRFNNRQQAELARLFSAPKVMHNIRLANKSKYPLTTAPALILRKDRVLGQGMMTYTAVGGTTDLKITAAVDVQVEKSDREAKRTPNAARWRGDNYDRFDLAGKITLTNHLKKDIDLEVTRKILGHVDEAGQKGVVEQLNMFDRYVEYPYWWNWYSWPYWWTHFNGIGQVTWKMPLKPGKKIELTYNWHYFWR